MTIALPAPPRIDDATRRQLLVGGASRALLTGRGAFPA